MNHPFSPSWLSQSPWCTGPTAHTTTSHPTPPALIAQLLGVCAEMLAATLHVLAHQAASEALAQAELHLRLAQEEVKAALEAQAGGGTP